MHENTETNGINEPAVYVQLTDDDPQLAREMTAEIEQTYVNEAADKEREAAGERRLCTPQEYEVARSFLARARALARLGEDDLAERQLHAARRVMGKAVGDE